MKHITGLAIRNYKGIGSEFQTVAPLSKFNFFVGENNSGKSSFLEFISRHLVDLSLNSKKTRTIENLERNIQGGQIECLTATPIDNLKATIAEKAPNLDAESLKCVDAILNAIANDGYVWTSWKEPFATKALYHRLTDPELSAILPSRSHWARLWSKLTGSSGGDLNAHWIPQTIDWLHNCATVSFPTTRIIPAKRVLGPTGEKFGDFSGIGLIDHLAKLQNPDVEERPNRQDFDKVNAFLKTVVEKSEAEIEIPHDRKHILVHLDNRVLPLSSLGTGIHEIILIAAFCTISKNEIVCIEEPESHLHPRLQKMLLNYLDSETDNQYFIATHSTAFMNKPNSSVFHVKLYEQQTTVSLAASPNNKHEICFELGYRPADLIQANCIIWVEGPSDRIYLNYWLRSECPKLTEGIDYSIMFYGGRLLSHLANDDGSLESFINLRNLNRRSAILIDSDKRSPQSKINETKQRLNREFSNDLGLCWITKGREIENYIDYDLLQSAVKQVHSRKYCKPHAAGTYDNALAFLRRNGELEAKVDKIGVANNVIEKPVNLNVLDLSDKIKNLAKFVQSSNL